MNLLLLLSAMLSALTGVGSFARQPQQAQAVAQQTGVRAPRVAARIAPARPVIALPAPKDVAVFPAPQRPLLAALTLYADRRRE